MKYLCDEFRTVPPEICFGKAVRPAASLRIKHVAAHDHPLAPRHCRPQNTEAGYLKHYEAIGSVVGTPEYPDQVTKVAEGFSADNEGYCAHPWLRTDTDACQSANGDVRGPFVLNV